MEVEKKLNNLTKKLHRYQKNDDFLLGRIYFNGADGYQDFLVFAPMLSELTVDNNKIVTS